MKKEKANFAIAVNWKDRWFLPACVSSIRRFYPEANITLLKDTFRGICPTSRLERRFNVTSYPVQRPYGGGGWIKLLPAIKGSEASFFNYPLMILDADIILLGAVFEEAAQIEGTVVVSPDPEAARSFSGEHISKFYLNVHQLREMGVTGDRMKSFPWFNSGHVLVRESYLDFDFVKTWIDWESAPITKRNPQLYPLTDQSLLNHYLLMNPQIKLGGVDFADWSEGDLELRQTRGEISVFKSSQARLIHYAGLAKIPFWEMPNWKFFQKENRTAEQIMGNRGFLVASHAIQKALKSCRLIPGPGCRKSLKKFFVALTKHSN